MWHFAWIITIWSILFWPAMACGGNSKAIFYVATNGSDNNCGSKEKPFATLARARDAIREMKRAEGLPDGGVTVYIRSGVYRLNQPLVFTPEDSGTKQVSIAYGGYPGEQPVLSGGRRITGWKQQGGLWIAEVPEVKAGQWYFHQLFINSRRAVRARTPNKGFYEAVKPIEPESKAGFYFRPGHIKNWQRSSDVDIILLHHWEESHCPIEKVDETANLVTFVGKAHYYAGWRNSFRYYIDNVFEKLDAPGEWYLNRETGVLYYRPRQGEDMNEAEVIAPVLHKLLCFEGNAAEGKFINNITLRDLTFSHTTWKRRNKAFTADQAAINVDAAIDMQAAVNCTIENCEATHLGEHAIWLDRGCQHNRITGCYIWDTGAGGVMIGEMKKRMKPAEQAAHNEVYNCRMHNGGLVWHGAVAVWISQSHHNLVAHNHISDFEYTGISIGMQWRDHHSNCHHNTVEFNYVHHVVRTMADGGGIYTMGNMPGTILRNNLVHDVLGDEYAARLCVNRGIFLDGASGGILIGDNIVYRTVGGPLDPFTKNTRSPNSYINNIFAFCEHQGLPWNRRADNSNQAHHNIVYAVQNISFYIDRPRSPKVYGELINNNLYWHPKTKMTFNKKKFSEWQAMGFDTNSVIADPLFVDPENGDFHLRPNSPALQLGFKPISTETVGLTDKFPTRFRECMSVTARPH